jgi:hypothetical protein
MKNAIMIRSPDFQIVLSGGHFFSSLLFFFSEKFSFQWIWIRHFAVLQPVCGGHGHNQFPARAPVLLLGLGSWEYCSIYKLFYIIYYS